MKKTIPTIIEIIEHFENVKEVKCLEPIYKKPIYTIKLDTIEYDPETKAYYCDTFDRLTDCCLWSKKYGYATILKYNKQQTPSTEIENTIPNKLKEIKEYLLKYRNTTKAEMETKAIEEDGYFDAQDYSGGNFDDCYNMGKENGEAELIEQLLHIIDKE